MTYTYQSCEDHIDLKSTLYKSTKMTSPWNPKQLKNRGPKMEQCNVTQAIHVDDEKFESIKEGNITAIIFEGIHHFKATHALIYSDDNHIDISIKQVRHTPVADIQIYEALNAGITPEGLVQPIVPYVNHRGHIMQTKRTHADDPVTYLEWVKR